MSTRLERLDENLWVTTAPLRFLGLEMGARMTVIRLPDSRLLLHSPIRPTPELLAEISELGEVAYLVAPNKLHHLFVGEWQEPCPQASVFVAPGLDEKRPDLNVTGVLGDEPESGWADAVDQVLMDGFPFANEVVFYHRATSTLIATDLAFNIGPSSPALTRLAFRASGTFGRLAPTLLERLLVKDRPAFRACLERVLAWPFERIIVAHGDVSESGGREELLRGYRWALGES